MTREIKLNALQIENILDKIVPMIASKEDQSFFRGVIGLKLENCNSAQASVFVKKILEEWAGA